MAVSLSQIRDLLFPGLWGISGKYPMIERQWPKVLRTVDSNMALERRTSVRYLGFAQLKQEGAPTAFDNNSGQRYTYNAEHFEIGLGYAITRKAIDDNLYKSEFGPSNDGLMESFKETEEMYAANLFNTGTTFNTRKSAATAWPYSARPTRLTQRRLPIGRARMLTSTRPPCSTR
jgi:hypothetical protein